MQINKVQQPIQTNLGSEEIEFSIEPSASAFIIEMLSSKLYTDPPFAMIRELITNAIDASPLGKWIRLELTELENLNSLLVVQDFGAGMNPACVQQILTKVGVSSKSHDNSAHGGYGIGILSVFAVSEQAQMDTVSAGIFYSYLLYRNENGVPALNLLEQRPATDREVGTKIQVPVKSVPGEENYMRRIIVFFRSLIQPQPAVMIRKLSGEVAELPIVRWFEGDSYAIVDAQSQSTFSRQLDERCLYLGDPRLVIKIGQIPYQASEDLITPIYRRLIEADRFKRDRGLEQFTFGGQTLSPEELNLLVTIFNRVSGKHYDIKPCGRSLVLPMEIGQLQLPGSREEILPNQANLDLIEIAMLKAVREIQAHYRQVYTESDQASLADKLQVALAFCLDEVTYQGRKYKVEDLTQKIYLHGITEDSKGKDVFNGYKHSISSLIVENQKPAILVNLRRHGQLRAVRSILDKNGLSDSTKFLTVDSVGSYQEILVRHPILRHVFDDTRLFRDEIKSKPKSPITPEAIERKEERRIQKLRESLASADNILSLHSVKSLGEKFANADPLEPIIRHKLFKSVSLPETGPIVYHLLDNLGGLDLLAWICLELEIDSHVYLLDDKTVESLRQVRREDLVDLASVVEPALSQWVGAHLAPIVEIGFLPLVNYLSCRKPYGSSLHNLLTATDVDQEFLLRLIQDPGIVQINQPALLSAYQQFSRNIQIWRILLEYGDSINFDKSRRVLEQALPDVYDHGVDRDLELTIRRLLDPALAKIPYIDQMLVRIRFFVSAEDWLQFATTTAALAWLMQKDQTNLGGYIDETPTK